YIKSKTLAQIPDTPDSWAELKAITITWIAGSDTNGGDRPDLHRFNIGSANKTGLPTDGDDGDYHARENLYVEFFDFNDLPMGRGFVLWKTKRDLVLSELNTYRAGGHLSGTTRPFSSASIPVNVYPAAGGFPSGYGASSETEFTTTSILAADFNINLSLAKFFVIRQTRHSDLLDNYGIKHVGLSFGA
ncbi:unnamed protein product, partial [marine sediment metagenome]